MLTTTRIGGEIQVNTATAGDQFEPRVAKLAGGGFVIVWRDVRYAPDRSVESDALKAQVFAADGGKIGGELTVSGPSSNGQVLAQVAALANGGFVVTWQDELYDLETGDITDPQLTGVKARIFDASGAALGSEFLVNTTEDHEQGEPQITALSNGGFVVTWTDNSEGMPPGGGDPTPAGSAVRAQIFGADGAEGGTEFRVNIANLGSQEAPQVTALVGGGFVIAWEDATGDAAGSSGDRAVRARVSDNQGATLGGDIAVNIATSGAQDRPEVTALAGGGFVIVWRDQSLGVGGATGDTSEDAIKVRMFSAAGAPAGPEIRVNTQTFGSQTDPSTAALPGGGFVIAWNDRGAIKSQIFAVDGAKLGGEISVGPGSDPEITVLPDGSFVVARTDGSSGGDIKARLFLADGTSAAEEIVVNTVTEDVQARPEIVALGNGFAVVWETVEQRDDLFPGDGLFFNFGVRAQVFSVADTPPGDPTEGDDRLADRPGNDTIDALGGDDRITVTNGQDQVTGGAGVDTLVIDYRTSVADVTNRAAAGFEGRIGNGAERNVEHRGIERFDISTGGGNDVLTFGAGDDVVNLGAGDDFVDLGAGLAQADGGDGEDGLSADFSAATSAVRFSSFGPSLTSFGPTGTSFRNFEYFGTLIAGSGQDRIETGNIDRDETLLLCANDDTALIRNGNDVVDGGEGRDLVEIRWQDSISDIVMAAPRPGFDIRLESGPGRSADLRSIERLFVDTGSGNDRIVTGAGNDSVSVLSGNDEIDLGEGRNQAFINYAASTAPVINAAAAAGFDLRFEAGPDRSVNLKGVTTIQIVGGSGDDRITTGVGDDGLTGNDGADVLAGGSGNDSLDGGGGADTLDGGEGEDRLSGGLGNDLLRGGRGNDSLVEFQVSNAQRFPSSPDGNGDDLLEGGEGDDVLAVLDGDDIVDGGSGTDSLHIFYGDRGPLPNGQPAPAVPVVNGVAPAGFDFRFEAGPGRSVNVRGVENLTVEGGSGADMITTGGGNDTLIDGDGFGRSADDVLNSGVGNDRITIVSGHDVVDGGDGNDSITINWTSSNFAVVNAAPPAGFELRFEQGSVHSVNLKGVENITIGGSSRDDRITTGAGNDSISDGPQGFSATNGNDIFNSGAGDDLVSMTVSGQDQVDGGTGADRLVVAFGGSAPLVTATALAGFDFRFEAGAGNALDAKGFEAIQIAGGRGDDVITTGAGNDEISDGDTTGSPGSNDTLNGGAGNDLFNIGGGNDVIDGGPGEDRLVIFYNSGSPVVSVAPRPGFDFRFEAGDGRSVDVRNVERIEFGRAGFGAADYTTGSGNDILTGDEGSWLAGGAGDDVYNVRDGVTIVETPGGGIDEIRTRDDFTLPEHVENLTFNRTDENNKFGFGNELDNVLTGAGGNDVLFGRGGDDLFILGAPGPDQFFSGSLSVSFGRQGEDTAIGGEGDDGFYFGPRLSSGDRVDGGPGSLDQIGLQGNYGSFGEDAAPFTFSPALMTGVEQLVLLPGSDTRFGDTSNALYGYNFKTVDENVAAGERLVVTFNTLRAGERVNFDGSAETDGYFLTYGGQSADVLTGGEGDDGFFFGTDKRFDASDSVDGRGGAMDQLGLQGMYAGANRILVGANQIVNVEMIVLLTGGDTRFGNDGLGYSYDLTMHDGNVLAGQTLFISANTLRSGESVTFDGSAETDGQFTIFSGAGADTITGGAGADHIVGGLGGDRLTGGGGGDTFVYGSAAESTGLGFDTLVGFDFRVARVDLPSEAPGFSDVVEGGRLDAASFDADLAAALNGVLGAGEAAIFIAGEGSFANRTFGIVDANGIAGYQQGEDYVFELVDPVMPGGPTTDFFI